MNHVDALLTAQPFGLLDGGIGRELIKRGVANRRELWSAQALIDAPEVVRDVHADYAAAGSDLLMTNTYSTNGNRLRALGLGDQVVPLNQLAGQLAREAADAAGRKVLVFASLPPLNGSYRPEGTLPYAELVPLYQEMVELLAPYVDGYICETMATADEGHAAAKAASDSGKETWIAWTVKDDTSARLRSGEPLADAVARIDDLPVQALMVNCASPEATSAALKALSSMPQRQGRAFGGYANGFTDIPENWGRWGTGRPLELRQDLGPSAYAGHVQEWYEAGARLIGGCCAVGPEHIEALNNWRRELALAA